MLALLEIRAPSPRRGDQSTTRGPMCACRPGAREQDAVPLAGASNRAPQASIPRTDAARASPSHGRGCRRGGDGQYVVCSFDRLKHPVVMSRVRARIADGRVLNLIEAFLKAGVLEDGVVSVPSEGSPQGGVISPWLANLVLDDLDKAIESKGWRHVRYADDFVVLCTTREEAEAALVFIKEVLERLGLSLHETKTRLVKFEEGFEFLGFRFRWYRLGIRPKAIERFKERIRMMTQRQQGRNVGAVITDLTPVIRGWAQYFGIGEVGAAFTHLDGWIRMRIRSFRSKRRRRSDNHRFTNRRLAKWGLLSLQHCRPKLRLSYMETSRPRELDGLLAMRTPRGVAQCVNGAR